MTDERKQDLAVDLERAGHSDLAEQLRRKQLASELRRAERDDLADRLEGKAEPPQTQEQQEAEAFLAELKQKSQESWVSTPGLLDQ